MRAIIILFICTLFLFKPAFASLGENLISNNYGYLSSSSISPEYMIFSSHRYQSNMSISYVGDELLISFSDGSYRRINLATNQVKDVSKLLHSKGGVEDGEVDRGSRITNYYLLTELDRPIWYLNPESQGLYDDYVLFAKLVESENTDVIASKPRDANVSLLQNTIDSYSELDGNVSDCALEKSLLDIGYNGYETWRECSSGTRTRFIIDSIGILTCFLPIPGSRISCGLFTLSLAASTKEMLDNGKHCTVTYERAEANYNRCYSSNEEKGADDPTRDTGGDGYNSGGLRCNRWQRVRNFWSGGQPGADSSGGWESREVCVSWVRD